MSGSDYRSWRLDSIQPFVGFDFSDFWANDKEEEKEYKGSEFSQSRLNAVERELGVRLPWSYVCLLKQRNGGMPMWKNYHPLGDREISWEKHVQLLGILGIGDGATHTLLSANKDRSLLPQSYIVFAHSPCEGDFFILDYSDLEDDEEPCVAVMNLERSSVPEFVANDFESFVRNLVSAERLDKPRARHVAQKEAGPHKTATSGKSSKIIWIIVFLIIAFLMCPLAQCFDTHPARSRVTLQSLRSASGACLLPLQ
jgi:hypothetical protein